MRNGESIVIQGHKASDIFLEAHEDPKNYTYIDIVFKNSILK